MMKFRIYTATGERGPQVWLDLRKGAVAERLLTVLQSHDLAKGGPQKFNISSLVKIDSGEFPVGGLSALGYSKSEIENAITGRIDTIAQECEELTALRGLIDATMGGREVALKRDWSNTVTGARKSLASANLTRDQKIEKSRGMGATSSSDILTAHSWERQDGTHGIDVFTHGKLKGHSVTVNSHTEAWEHKKGQQTIGQSERGDEPQVCAATLNSHLMTTFHRKG